MRLNSRFLSLISAFAAALALVLVNAKTTEAKPSFAVKPAPTWIKAAEVNTTHAAAGRPSSILFDDQEVRLSSKTVDWFYRHVERVDTTAGLESVAQLRFDFEPSYQTLAIHFVRIIRGNQTIEALKPSEIKVIQKEEELDEQLYNGTLEAVAFLNDVRVGDIVDYAYTVTGDNPVFGGRFADRFYLADREPIQALRIRILLPSSRALHIGNRGTNVQPRVTSLDNETEYLWEQSDVPAVDLEDFTPAWFDRVPFVVASEFSDWRAVVQWALPLYRVNEPLAAEVRAKSDAWSNQFPRPEQRMVAALRFVQQDIRYLGIELGSYSHQPNPPSRILARRFGDCKDKSLLLSTILNHIGIDSAVALVSTSARHAVEGWQPSPQDFDHVIVQARAGGKTYWLDPTFESQRGNIDQYYDLPYERALVLRPDISGLETIPTPKVDSPTTVVSEHYAIKDNDGPVPFTVTSTYRAGDADDMRYKLSQHSPAEMGRDFLNYYAESNPSIKADGLPQIQDDADSDTIVITEKYVIESFWKDQYHYFSGDLIYTELQKPDISKRSMPLAISHPTFIKQIIAIDLPARYDLAPHSEVIADDAFRFEYTYQSSASTVNLSYSLQTLSDHVPAGKVAGYLAQVDRVRNATGLQVPRSSAALVRATRGQPFNSLTVFALLAAGGAILVAFLVIRARRKREENQPAFRSKQPLGATPETAVRCKHLSDIEVFIKRFRCGCGGYPFKPEALPNSETLLYDGERLAILKLKCDACGRANDLYFVKPATPEITDGSISSP